METVSASTILGYVDERSARHLRGWAHDPAAPGRRLAVQAVLDGTVLAEALADGDREDLRSLGIGDGHHGFAFALPRLLDPAERARLLLRAGEEGHVLPLSPWLVTHRPLLTYVAMDIVDNCNLRCPFCVYDYREVKRTNAMSRETWDKALRLLPLTGAGHFWLSCLHEPTLHPRFTEFLRDIPPEHGGNCFFTTNLARRMPAAYYRTLAASGLHHVNVSLESLDPPLYERMRKGARFGIFRESWDALLAAFRAVPRPPQLRYNLMAYRSNLEELPGLARHLLAERDAAQVEIRATMEVAHIPDGFGEAEYLDDAGWARLHEGLRGLPPGKVLLVVPPHLKDALAAPDGPLILPNAIPAGRHAPDGLAVRGPLDAQLTWEGRFAVYGNATDPGTGKSLKVLVAHTYLHAVEDVEAFVQDLADRYQGS